MNEVIICLFAAAGFDRAAQGMAGAGRRLADESGAKLHAVIIGAPHEALTSALNNIADVVTVAAQAELAEYQPEVWLHALTQICQPLAPRAVLLGNDTYSQELAPRLAHRLGGSAVGDGIAVQLHDGNIRVTRSAYGGKAQAVVELKRSPAVAWLRARAFAPATAREEIIATVSNVTLELPADERIRIVERVSETTGEARLEDAKVIVSGGRGLGGPEPFADLQALAAMLGGMTAASRAACDSGWCPPSWQVGQTGKKVAPGLYLAIAIHGASQHLAGMSDSQVIAAINIDPDAPIFRYCRFGIVADYKKVVPLLREKLAALQQ